MDLKKEITEIIDRYKKEVSERYISDDFDHLNNLFKKIIEYPNHSTIYNDFISVIIDDRIEKIVDIDFNSLGVEKFKITIQSDNLELYFFVSIHSTEITVTSNNRNFFVINEKDDKENYYALMMALYCLINKNVFL